MPGWVALLIAAALAAGCGGSGGEEEPPESAARQSVIADPPPGADRNADRDPTDSRNEPGRENNTDAGADDGGDPASADTDVQRVQRAASRYVEALSDGDGAAVCSALADEALDGVQLPKTRGGCAGSLDASIGYRDPRGVPVFDGADLVAFDGVELSGDAARVTATIVTDFADRSEPSIEDDVIYLVRDGGDWLIAKASPTLYRAIGAAEVPPDALAPPG